MPFPPLHFLNGYQPFFFLPIIFIFSFSLQTLQLPLLLDKSLCPLLISSSLIIWNSNFLSNSLILSNGTQDQDDLLLDYWWSFQPHPLSWSHKANWVPSIALQATKSSSRECMDRIGEFFKIFSFCFDLLF